MADVGVRWAAVLAGCMGLSGCASFTAAPITPVATMRSFEERSLNSAEVQNYVASHVSAGNTAGPVTTWDVQSLTLAAFYFSPELDLARAKSATAGAAVQTASQRPNPSLQLPFEYTSNPKPGDSPYTLGLGLDIPIETAGKRGYRVARARRRSRLLDQQVQARQQVVQMLHKRLAAGAVSAPEVHQARAALMQDRLELAKANQQGFDALAGAAAVIGLPARALETEDIRLDAFLADPPDLPGDAAREHALLNRADLLASLADYEASQASLQLEVANQYPDIRLGPGYTYDAGARKFALSLSGITLPLFNQNQGPIAEATARRHEAAARFDAIQAQAIGQVDRAVRHHHAALTARRLSESLQATQERQLAAVRKAFELGETDRLSLALAEVDANSAALAREDALAQVQRAAGDVEDAMQIPLSASPALSR